MASPDDRILIIDITKEDIDYWDKEINLGKVTRSTSGTIPDQVIEMFFKEIESFEPKVIGLNLERPFQAQGQLKDRLRSDKRIYTVCKVLDSEQENSYANSAAPEFELDRQGFSDVQALHGEKVRRYLFNMTPDGDSPCQAEYAFSFRLALHYLTKKPLRDGDNFRIGSGIIKPIKDIPTEFLGEIDAGGNQMLLDYVTVDGKLNNIAEHFTINNILNKEVQNIQKYKNRIILLGVSDPSISNIWTTPINNQTITNNVLNAQMISQILRIENKESTQLLYSSIYQDLTLIFLTAMLGCTISRYTKIRAVKISLIIISLSYCFLYLVIATIYNVVLPLLPMLLSLFLSLVSCRYMYLYITARHKNKQIFEG